MYQGSSSRNSSIRLEKFGERSGILVFVIGFALLSMILITQYLFIKAISSDNNQINLTEDSVKWLTDISIPTFVIILFSLALNIHGLS
jgi:hypothetical protein